MNIRHVVELTEQEREELKVLIATAKTLGQKRKRAARPHPSHPRSPERRSSASWPSPYRRRRVGIEQLMAPT